MIAGRPAIEIGAGSGDLAHHLDIPATDNRMQEWPEIKAYYDMLLQPTITYPASVETLDAETAIAKYRPKVVVASWVTEWIDRAPLWRVLGVHQYDVMFDGKTSAYRAYRCPQGLKRRKANGTTACSDTVAKRAVASGLGGQGQTGMVNATLREVEFR